MAQISVRDLEIVALDKLKAQAKKNGRSLEVELRLILQHSAAEDREAMPAEVERIRALFADRTFGDSAELIREDRER